jgi:calmodulin-lysine N-methyltransferase
MAALSSLNSTFVFTYRAMLNCFFDFNFHAEGTSSDKHIKDGTNNISRKASRGFNLIECHSLPISQLVKSLGNENDLGCQKDVYVYYKLPCGGSSKLNLV